MNVEPRLRTRVRASDPDAFATLFDETSLKLIGERTILASIGLSTDATAIISQGFVDRIGQTPAS